MVLWSAEILHKSPELHLPPITCKYLCCSILLGKGGLILFISSIITAPHRLKLSAQQQKTVATYPAKLLFIQSIQGLTLDILFFLWNSEKVWQISTHLLCNARVNRRENELILFYLNILSWTVLYDHDLLHLLNTWLILTVRVISLTSVFKLSSAFKSWVFS